jgi:N-acetylglucosamine malate deacetylase 2
MGLLATPALTSHPHLSVESAPAPKILLVVAHPDDEYYVAATVFRLSRELGATVDQVIITNGEAGYRYSALAEAIYGLPLTQESVGRDALPAIRRQETLAAGRILGIRHHHFLEQKDHCYTLDASETLNQVWCREQVLQSLQRILSAENYDFVFTLLPREDTHGHHQAATLLTLEAVDLLPSGQRPVVLGAEATEGSAFSHFSGLRQLPRTRTLSPLPLLSFDRRRSVGAEVALRYATIVHWIIAEHKSQGLFQNDVGRHDFERFWLFATGPSDAPRRLQQLSGLLTPATKHN